MPDFRKGDRVSLLGTVKGTYGNNVSVDLDAYYSPVSVDRDSVTLVRKFFDIGDEIEWELTGLGQKERGIVRHSHKEFLWVEGKDEMMNTIYQHQKPTIVRTAAEIEAARDRLESSLAIAREPPVAPATPPRNDPPATPAADPADDIQF